MYTALREYHLMVGLDVHFPVIPPGLWPYLVANNMNNTLKIHLTTLYTPSVWADSLQQMMCKGSDIGMLIPHLGPMSAVIVIEVLLSGSKCYFGPSNVLVRDQHGGVQNPAAAVLGKVNVNLNCGFPVPLMSNVVLAPNTATLRMTAGDIAGGLYVMLVDQIFQTTINLFAYFVIGPLCNWFGRKVLYWMGVRGLGRGAARLAARTSWKAAGKAGPLGSHVNSLWRVDPTPFANVLQVVIENPINFFISSPVGTASDSPAIGLPSVYGWLRQVVEEHGVIPSEADIRELYDGPSEQSVNPGTAVDDYFDDTSVEEFGAH